MVQYGIRQATETMQQMTSVERILQYTDLEPVMILIDFWLVQKITHFNFVRKIRNQAQLKNRQRIGHELAK